jgi:very-short-patch-repair endonuclease
VVRQSSRTPDQVAAEIAEEAHGVVAHKELLHAGVSEGQIRHRLSAGALIRRYPGVYRVGHCAPSIEADYMAAVRACGEGALLTGRAAAHLFEIIKGRQPRPEVIAPTERRVKGIATRRSRNVDARDATTHKGIPVTTVARTLVEIAPALSLADLARSCHEAEVKHGATPAQIEDVLARRPNSPGAAKLRQVIRGEVHITLSKLEAGFLELLRANRLPLPHTNRTAGTKRVDCRWPERRVTVELDSFQYHNTRYSWEQDRVREREAHARGDTFRRYTYRDVFEHPAAMLRDLRAVLSIR